MTQYVVISASVLTVLGYGVLILLRRRLSEHDKNKYIVSLSITLVGTFVGVSIALVVYDIKRERDERMRLECLYEAAIAEGKAYSSDVAHMIWVYETSWSLAKGEGTSTLRKEIMTLNGSPPPVLPPPTILETIGGEAVLYQYMSPGFRKNIMRLIRIGKAHPPYFEIDPASSVPADLQVRLSLHRLAMIADLQTESLQEERKYLRGERSSEDMDTFFDVLLCTFTVETLTFSKARTKPGISPLPPRLRRTSQDK